MNSGTPEVSVVIPTYNQAGFLREALASVIAQTFSAWEAVVVNNFSDDETEETVKGFGDSRLKLVNFRNNGIIAASRNEGIKRSSREFVAFLDSDDVWLPKKLEKCVAEFSSGAGLVCHALEYIRDGKVLRIVKPGPNEKTGFPDILYCELRIPTSAVMARKDELEKAGLFDENPRLVTAEDYDMWIRLSAQGTRFRLIPEVLGRYRVHGASASRSAMRHMEASQAVLESHLSGLKNPGIWRKLQGVRKKALIYYGAAGNMLRSGERNEVLKVLARSIFLFPLVLRAYLLLLIYFLKLEKFFLK